MADLTMRHDLVPVKLPPVLGFIMGVDFAPRASVERLIQKAIDALDELDGDPDAEPVTWSEDIIREDECPDDCEDDDPCGQIDEDGINTCFAWVPSNGPGCTISDPGEDDDPSGQCDEDGMNYGDGYHDRLPDGLNYFRVRPVYGDDQSSGPTNYQAAYREHMRREYDA